MKSFITGFLLLGSSIAISAPINTNALIKEVEICLLSKEPYLKSKNVTLIPTNLSSQIMALNESTRYIVLEAKIDKIFGTPAFEVQPDSLFMNGSVQIIAEITKDNKAEIIHLKYRADEILGQMSQYEWSKCKTPKTP